MVFGLFLQAHQSQAATYWLLSQKQFPPYPYDPYEGVLKLEKVETEKDTYLVLDTQEDFEFLEKIQAAEREKNAGEEGGVAEGASSSSFCSFGEEGDLWLRIISKTNDTAHLVILTSDPDGIYDLFMTTNLSKNVAGLNQTNWVWLFRSSPGETNLVVTNLWHAEAYFQLGTMADCDNDGLTDACEHLVRHTSESLPDTDGDGLSDGLESELSFSPLNPYSQDQTQTFKDGKWLLTARNGQTGTSAGVSLENSIYDPVNDITFLLFAVTGVTNTDQHHIYVRTPSLDATDTNLVWQDMFFNFGFTDWSFDPNTGTHWYETAWFGNATNLIFAALDSKDRDSDGLQDGYELYSTLTIVGCASSDANGVTDGDREQFDDGLSFAQKWQYGLHPLVAANPQDTVGDYMPDWFRDYTTIWYGSAAAAPWADADGDNMPNLVEHELGSDPTIDDNWGWLPPPPGDHEFASLEFSMFHGDGEGPYYLDGTNAHGNEFFTFGGFSAGPLGLACGMVVLTTNGPGVAQLHFEILPLDLGYTTWAPFTDDGDPAQGELQRPDPIDADFYRSILFQATQVANGTWTEINETVLEALSAKTLEYIHAVSMIRIHRECRKIQYYQYLLAQGANSQAILMRIRKSVSLLHTEKTIITAVEVRYATHYPNLDWLGRSVRCAGFVACGASWYYNWPSLLQNWRDYRADVRNHRNWGAADILSSQIQSMLQDLPGLRAWLAIGLNPTIPIFSLNGPLGWYDGY
jgi:hypothetical protein